MCFSAGGFLCIRTFGRTYVCVKERNYVDSRKREESVDVMDHVVPTSS